MNIQLSFAHPFRPLLTGLLAATVGLAVGLTACSSNEPAETATAPAANTVATTASAASTVATPAPDAAAAISNVYAKDNIAISGADPVAYFTEQAYVAGSSEYTYDWEGVMWQFATAENRDTFMANPEQYAPQYGGFCAWAVAVKNSLVPTDPNAWSVVDGKLYLNANESVQTRWQEDVPGFIAKADSQWPALSGQ